MITMDGIEYDDNLNLETIDFVASTALADKITLSHSTSLYDNNHKNFYIYNGELYIYINDHLYKYNGFNCDDIYTGNNHLIFSGTNRYKTIIKENYIYFIDPTSNSNLKVYRMNPTTYEVSIFINLPSDTTYWGVYDAVIYNNYLYMITRSKSTSSNERISKISLSNITNPATLSTVYINNDELTCTNLIVYKDKLYVTKESPNILSSDKMRQGKMFEIVNDNLQLVSTLPIKYSGSTNSNIHLSRFFTDDDYIYICPYKENFTNGQFYCIWRYNGETWSPYIPYPVIKNSTYCTNKYYNLTSYIHILENNALDINSRYEVFLYNGSFHAVGPTDIKHYIYNKDLHEWLEAGYWICKIKDDTSQITT